MVTCEVSMGAQLLEYDLATSIQSSKHDSDCKLSWNLFCESPKGSIVNVEWMSHSWLMKSAKFSIVTLLFSTQTKNMRLRLSICKVITMYFSMRLFTHHSGFVVPQLYMLHMWDRLPRICAHCTGEKEREYLHGYIVLKVGGDLWGRVAICLPPSGNKEM